mgnify:CR=1 FL=1
MTNEELVRAALEKVGGKSNVLTATNCMTRLRAVSYTHLRAHET